MAFGQVDGQRKCTIFTMDVFYDFNYFYYDAILEEYDGHLTRSADRVRVRRSAAAGGQDRALCQNGPKEQQRWFERKISFI